jgi:hypothetical protein
MRRTNREVNIFNMSLLDILCGALGAFCFMMLALFPSYIKAQNLKDSGSGDPQARAEQAQQRADQAEQRAKQAEEEAAKAKGEQSLLYFKIAWSTPDDVDMWLKDASGNWYMVKKDADPSKPASAGSFLNDTEKGPGSEQNWFKGVQGPNQVWELYAELHSRGPGSSGPVTVIGSGVIRGRVDDKNNFMAEVQLGTVALTNLRERVLISPFGFDETGNGMTTAAPKAPQSGGPRPTQ